MVIVETSIFTRQVLDTLSEEEYRELQTALVQRPELGKVIPGSGGLRKARWSAKGAGKSGGVRVVYYWAVAQEKLLMLFLFAKNERVDLTQSQIRILRGIVEREYP